MEQGGAGTPEYAVVQRLMEKKWQISFAESCTGGLAAARLISVPNTSWVLQASFVTYSEAAKSRYAGVSPETLARCGVVSEEVAREMAAGAAKSSGAQVGVGVTGLAGPGGGTAEKPVGMVCFGFWIDGAVTSHTVQFGPCGRSSVRQKSVDFIYAQLQKLLQPS